MDEGHNFNVRFAKRLEPQELVINGWENVSLEVLPMNEDHNAIVFVKFCLIDGEIVIGVSSGRRNEIYSICLLPIRLCVY